MASERKPRWLDPSRTLRDGYFNWLEHQTVPEAAECDSGPFEPRLRGSTYIPPGAAESCSEAVLRILMVIEPKAGSEKE